MAVLLVLGPYRNGDEKENAFNQLCWSLEFLVEHLAKCHQTIPVGLARITSDGKAYVLREIGHHVKSLLAIIKAFGPKDKPPEIATWTNYLKPTDSKPKKRVREWMVEGGPSWLPPGWKWCKVQRTFGSSAGTFDRYFLAPNGRTIRTKTEVFKYDPSKPYIPPPSDKSAERGSDPSVWTPASTWSRGPSQTIHSKSSSSTDRLTPASVKIPDEKDAQSGHGVKRKMENNSVPKPQKKKATQEVMDRKLSTIRREAETSYAEGFAGELKKLTRRLEKKLYPQAIQVVCFSDCSPQILEKVSMPNLSTIEKEIESSIAHVCFQADKDAIAGEYGPEPWNGRHPNLRYFCITTPRFPSKRFFGIQQLCLRLFPEPKIRWLAFGKIKSMPIVLTPEPCACPGSPALDATLTVCGFAPVSMVCSPPFVAEYVITSPASGQYFAAYPSHATPEKARADYLYSVLSDSMRSHTKFGLVKVAPDQYACLHHPPDDKRFRLLLGILPKGQKLPWMGDLDRLVSVSR
mmetsp:Transcript_20292/g.30369  ORF Transcript_20292/g.30369 Transcript_20292/m.30369 type:complete len:518 (+) Transcript_20292:40-1593(+)